MRIILNKRIARVALCGVVGLALIGFGACSASNGAATSGGRIRIVVAENFWGSIVGQLAGPDAAVTSIITNPATDPHDYEPTAQDARTIASARYVIVNGIGYDGWAQKLIDANPSSGRTVLNVGDLLGLDAGANPHQWYSPASVHRFVARVTADLVKIDAAHSAAYEARARAFRSSGLRTYDRLIAQIRAQFAGTPIGASESIMSPMAAALGLRMMTPARFLDAIAEGNEPTESDKATADAQIAAGRIKVFVFNSQNATPDVQRLVDAARRERIPVTTVTETLAPANVTFQAWQVRQLRALLGALKETVRS
jgi:zinc/manganese transport system substrate-binding protein